MDYVAWLSQSRVRSEYGIFAFCWLMINHSTLDYHVTNLTRSLDGSDGQIKTLTSSTLTFTLTLTKT